MPSIVYAEGHLCCVTFMLSFTNKPFILCHYAECRYAERRGAFQLGSKLGANIIKLSLTSSSKFRGKFVEQKLKLSRRFKCDQIRNNHWYELGHTLLSCLRLTWLFNKPATGNK
jgi:hypothetical protein